MAIVFNDDLNGGGTWEREFIITDKDFEVLRQLVNYYTGINLSESKRELVYSRLAGRLRKNNLRKFSDYCKLLQEDTEGEEVTFFRNAITTNLTSFFREQHHFDYLKNTILHEYKSNPTPKKRLRIWSAGCSTGEEPYSIAMVLKESNCLPVDCDTKILATDIDSSVLNTATEGAYPVDKTQQIAPHRIKKWFLSKRSRKDGKIQLSGELKKYITFKELNLMREWPMKGPFDIIFCRNVLIYFSKPTQKVLIERFANLLTDNGYLFIGHSESLFRITDRFKLVGQTIYKKIK